MEISKTHFYEIHELNQIIQELEYSPIEDYKQPIMDWLETENRGEYLINILTAEEIMKIKDYIEG